MKDNYFVSLYVLGVLIFYFTSLAWAVKADKRDKLKERIILLDDNLLEDEYLYIITVYTGFKPNSGTSANVSVKLVGGDGESKVHVLKSSVRRTQQYGNDDWYLICTSKSLGEITSIQIWHDNSGSSPDWYLWKVEVRDAQTDKSWIFFANRWLAVLQKHECLCLQIAPASLDDVSKVSALSKVNIFFGFKEVHTWLSIFVRHPRATVSRSQRLSLLISLMLNTMFGSLMFYKIGTADDTFYEYEIQLQHIIIALESMFIETLMTSLILYCFNKSKSEDEFSEIPKLITEKPKEETEKKLKLTKEALIELSSSKLREMLEMKPFNPALLEQTPRKGKKKDLWLRMAWFLCIVNIVFCSFFTVWLSLKVGEVKAMAWLTSVIFGLVHGLFITKPLRIVLYGFLLAAVYHVQPNISSYYVNAHEVKIYKVERSKLKTGEDIAKERRKAMYMPPTCEQVKQAQETRRIKEVRRTLFIDLIFKITTLVCMFSILRYIKFGTQYHAAQYVSSVITKSSYAKIVDPEAVLFDEITSQSMFYRFMSHTLSPSVHKYMWFTEETMDKESGWISANNWKLLGVIRLRQRRVEKVPCPSLPFFNVSNCFDFDSEYTDDHEFSWNDDDDTFASQPSDSESMWHFQEAQNAVFNFGSSGSDIDSGGYIASLGNNLEDTERVLSILESSKWIDDGTQILYVEFVLINPSNDFLSAVKLIVERLSFGLYTTRTQVETAQVYLKSGSIIFLSVTVGLTFLLFLLSWIRILVLINRFSLLTFIKNFWNCADILSAVSLFLVVLIFLFKMIVTNNVIKNYRSDESIQFEEFSRIIFWYKLLMLTIEIVIFLTFIRFLKLLQFFFSHRVFEFTVIAAQQMLSAVYFLAFCVTLYIFSVYALVGNKLLSGIVPTFISNFFNFGPQYKVHSHVDSISFPIILRFVVLVSLFKCVLVVHYYAARRICKLKSS